MESGYRSQFEVACTPAEEAPRKGKRDVNRSTAVLLTELAVLVSSCGGSGGGGGDSETGNPIPTVFVTVSGQVTFDFAPAVSGGMGLPRLDYDAIVRRPVRQVTVQILNDQTGALLAAATSDDTGSYSVSVPADTTVQLRARAALIQSGSPGWNFRVVDNVQSNALFVP